VRRAIHWFRRDLRITDNTGFDHALAHAGEVICVYVLSTWKSGHRWTGSPRQQFLCGCLASLDANLRSLGSALIFREGDPVEALATLAQETQAELLTFNRDPDPFGRATEERLQGRLGRLRIEGFKDVVLHGEDEVLTGAGEPYRVFTPYARTWNKLSKRPARRRPSRISSPTGIRSLPVPDVTRWGLVEASGILEAGEKAARRRLTAFLAEGLSSYGDRRNTPAGQTTSRLSQDLRFGLLSIREVFERCQAARLPAPGRSSATVFLTELVWREFYMAILAHFPDVLQHEFLPKMRGLRWPGRTADFERWCAGETGFPIVDAAMRQLRSTGFMHNRTRMIAAMFLTKDLHLDWRMGESYFMRTLVDGEIASNNGGWQWSAGTGADAAPYFRIQNPWTQTARFDPQGLYIKEWIPELRDVPAEKLASPTATPLARGYPAPMLDHAQAREQCLAMFASVRER
jgi:deoxyribodipyrimidine photo-lyase